MSKQRSFDIDPQPSLFSVEDQDRLDHLADQATAEDEQAGRELARWAKP